MRGLSHRVLVQLLGLNLIAFVLVMSPVPSPPTAFAEEPQVQEGSGTILMDQGVTERGTDTRDHRTGATPPPAPPQPQQGPQGPYQIEFLDTNPETFEANVLIRAFSVYIGCRPGLRPRSPECPESRPGLTLEIWHTQSGGQPILFTYQQNASISGSVTGSFEGVTVPTELGIVRVPGSRLVSPTGFFTVKLLSGTVVLAERTFEIIPLHWTVRNPPGPRDHRSIR